MTQTHHTTAAPSSPKNQPRYWILGVALMSPLLLAATCSTGAASIDDEVCGEAEETCEMDEFCNYVPESSCGEVSNVASCEVFPDACADIFEPVCGCDEETYANACEAAVAGVSILRTGECEPEVPVDGCEDDEVCLFDGGTCGDDDEECTCVLQPEACDTDYDPVCGCNDETYGNECEATRAGVSIVYTGECVVGFCEVDELCEYPVGSCGEDADACECAPMPEDCDDVYEPVCGCDDETYGNACEAARAGVSIVYEEECTI